MGILGFGWNLAPFFVVFFLFLFLFVFVARPKHVCRGLFCVRFSPQPDGVGVRDSPVCGVVLT